eukprot:403354998
MKSILSKISIGAALLLATSTTTQARLCEFDSDCPHPSEVCLANECEKFIDPDFLKYYVEGSLDQLQHNLDETVTHAPELFSMVTQLKCKVDAHCPVRGTKCIRGYCQLRTLALYEEYGLEEVEKYVAQEFLDNLEYAQIDQEILNELSKRPQLCLSDEDCGNDLTCSNNICLRKYLSLSHSDESDVTSDQDNVTGDDTLSLAVVKKCSTNGDCGRGQVCRRAQCQYLTLLTSLFRD